MKQTKLWPTKLCLIRVCIKTLNQKCSETSHGQHGTKPNKLKYLYQCHTNTTPMPIPYQHQANTHYDTNTIASTSEPSSQNNAYVFAVAHWALVLKGLRQRHKPVNMLIHFQKGPLSGLVSRAPGVQRWAPRLDGSTLFINRVAAPQRSAHFCKCLWVKSQGLFSSKPGPGQSTSVGLGFVLGFFIRREANQAMASLALFGQDFD